MRFLPFQTSGSCMLQSLIQIAAGATAWPTTPQSISPFAAAVRDRLEHFWWRFCTELTACATSPWGGVWVQPGWSLMVLPTALPLCSLCWAEAGREPCEIWGPQDLRSSRFEPNFSIFWDFFFSQLLISRCSWTVMIKQSHCECCMLGSSFVLWNIKNGLSGWELPGVKSTGLGSTWRKVIPSRGCPDTALLATKPWPKGTEEPQTERALLLEKQETQLANSTFSTN